MNIQVFLMAPQPEDIDINVYKSHRSSPRWEFCKGFFKGAIGPALLGVLSGAAIGFVGLAVGTILEASAFSFSIGLIPALEVMGLVGLATGIVSGSLAGYNHARREERSALSFNRDIDKVISAKVAEQLKSHGVSPLSVANEEIAQNPAEKSNWVSRLANRAASIVTNEPPPGSHLATLMESRSDPSGLER